MPRRRGVHGTHLAIAVRYVTTVCAEGPGRPLSSHSLRAWSTCCTMAPANLSHLPLASRVARHSDQYQQVFESCSAAHLIWSKAYLLFLGSLPSISVPVALCQSVVSARLPTPGLPYQPGLLLCCQALTSPVCTTAGYVLGYFCALRKSIGHQSLEYLSRSLHKAC